MSVEMKMVKAVKSLKEAQRLLAEAISINPENEYLEMIDTQIWEAVICITSVSKAEKQCRK
jgi:hypothetical protein